MFGIGPHEGREGEESRTEPSIKYIFILFDLYFLTRQVQHLHRLLHSFFFVPGCYPIVISGILLNFFSFFEAEIGRNSMSPPQLTRNTPVSQVLNPSEPSVLLAGRHNHQILVLHSCNHVISDVSTFHVPLRLDYWLDYVVRTLTFAQTHFVIFLLHKKTFLF